MEIRKAGIKEIPVIRNLAEVIWPEAYGQIISSEQISYMLHLMYSEKSLEDQMAKAHCFLLALKAGIPVGFAAYSPKSPEEANVFRLHKLYVLPRQHAQGTGSLLLNKVIEEAKAGGGDTLELNVNKINPAKDFYTKKGFTVFREEVLQIGNGFVMDDYVMRLNIPLIV